jgi:hypothetical protein
MKEESVSVFIGARNANGKECMSDNERNDTY